MKRCGNILFAMLLLGAQHAFAADSTATAYKGWVSINLGGASLVELALSWSGTVTWDKQVVSVRYLRGIEIALLFDPVPERNFYEGALLYGIRFGSPNAFNSIAGGLSVMKYTDRGSVIGKTQEFFSEDIYEVVKGTEIGLAVESQHFLGIWDSLDLGVTLFASINTRYRWYGAMFSLRFGDLE